MSSLIPPSMIPSFNGTLGVMFIGMSLGAILYGITCAQIFLYATSERSHKDTWPLKTWIYIVFVVDTAHQITTTMTLYRFLITDYLNPIALLSTSKSSGAFYAHITAIFITVVIFQVQLFFAWRLWTFGHSVSFGLRWILSFLTFSTAVLTFSCGIIVAANTVPSIHLGSTALDPLGPDVISWQIQLPAAIACDLFITFGMVLNLYHARTSFQRTNEVLNSLLLFTVNSGLLLVVVSTACLITFYVLPADNLTFVALEFLIPKCYTNAMLATLNSREYLREKMTTTILSEMTTKGVVSGRFGMQIQPDGEASIRSIRLGANSACTTPIGSREITFPPIKKRYLS